MGLDIDLTGIDSANYVIEERIIVTKQQADKAQLVFTSAGPFFGEDMLVYNVSPSGHFSILTQDQDYYLVGRFGNIGGLTNHVYCAIYFPDPNLIGDWYVSYHALGGRFVVEEDVFIDFFNSEYLQTLYSKIYAYAEVDAADALIYNRDIVNEAVEYACFKLKPYVSL